MIPNNNLAQSIIITIIIIIQLTTAINSQPIINHRKKTTRICIWIIPTYNHVIDIYTSSDYSFCFEVEGNSWSSLSEARCGSTGVENRDVKPPDPEKVATAESWHPLRETAPWSVVTPRLVSSRLRPFDHEIYREALGKSVGWPISTTIG